MRWVTCCGDLLPRVYLAAVAEFTASYSAMNLPPLLQQIWTPAVNQYDLSCLVLCRGQYIPNELISTQRIRLRRTGKQVKIETVTDLLVAEHV
jgi:hypothetical protein